MLLVHGVSRYAQVVSIVCWSLTHVLEVDSRLLRGGCEPAKGYHRVGERQQG